MLSKVAGEATPSDDVSQGEQQKNAFESALETLDDFLRSIGAEPTDARSLVQQPNGQIATDVHASRLENWQMTSLKNWMTEHKAESSTLGLSITHDLPD